MSVFEFVLALTSVISGLALAHIISGVVGLLRHARRVRFSLPHALWMWSGVAITIGNWASDWELRSLTAWPAWTLLIMIASKLVQYVFCVFVTPDIPAEGDIDLEAFHLRERRGYLLTALAFGAVAMLFNLTFGGAAFYTAWLRDSALTLAGMSAVLLALVVPARWAQLTGAGVFAALATYFLFAVSTLGAA